MCDFIAAVGDLAQQLWAAVPGTFWSGIIGVLVGGGITFLSQSRGFREQRRQRNEDREHEQRARNEDRERQQRALAHALHFKLIRVHSDNYSLHRHIEDHLERAASEGLSGDPWQFVPPLATFGEPVHFSAEEMGMLLGLNDIDVFNRVIDMDVVHNGLVEAARALTIEHRTLTERLKVDGFEGYRLTALIDRETELKLRPQMISVDSLIEAIRTDARKATEDSHTAMEALQKLLKAKLDVSLKFESKFKPTT